MSSPKLNIISTLHVTVIVTVLVLTCEGAKNYLLSVRKLDPGQSLDVGAYSLKMQTVCNLALFDNNEVIWTSNRGSNQACSAFMEAGGNLVIYNTGAGAGVVWASNTWQGEKRNYVLVLLADRNVAIFGPRTWHAGTNVKSVGGNVVHTVVANGTVGEGFIQSLNATINIVGEISPHTPTVVAQVDPKNFSLLAKWQREYTMETILTQLKKEMSASHNRKLVQPLEGTFF